MFCNVLQWFAITTSFSFRAFPGVCWQRSAAPQISNWCARYAFMRVADMSASIPVHKHRADLSWKLCNCRWSCCPHFSKARAEPSSALLTMLPLSSRPSLSILQTANATKPALLRMHKGSLPFIAYKYRISHISLVSSVLLCCPCGCARVEDSSWSIQVGFKDSSSFPSAGWPVASPGGSTIPGRNLWGMSSEWVLS